MAFLDAPQLKYLFISNVKITQYKALKNIDLPNLEIINIDKNLGNKISLQRTRLKNHIQSLILEFNNNGFIV